MKILKNGKLVTVSRSFFKSESKVVTGNAVPEAISPESPVLTEGDVSPYENNTVAELKILLDNNEIAYPKTAKKADLMELAESIVESDVI